MASAAQPPLSGGTAAELSIVTVPEKGESKVKRMMRWRGSAAAVSLAIVIAAAGCGDDDSSPPETGSLAVTTVTTGSDLDADGYTFSVDGGAGRSIAINATESVSNLSPGTYDVVLSGVAANCVVDASSKSTSVTAGSTASVVFNVACSQVVGAVEVTVATSGENLDPDGYTITIGSQSESVATNGSVTLSDLPVGTATVEIGGLAANCTADANSKDVTVSDGQTAQVDFSVTCVSTVGDIEVSVTTTGDDVDPDGYSVTVGSDTQAIDVNGQVTFAGLAPGSYDVSIEGIAANCTADATPKNADVTAGGTTPVSFSVTCSFASGSLEVIAVTTGTNQDPDGYTTTLDATSSLPLPTNGSATFSDLTIGMHTVSISGLAGNCQVQNGITTLDVDVAGGPNQVTFNISCFGPASGKIIFHTNRDGNFEIYSMNGDGTGKTNLTNNPALDLNPAVRPDGLYIAFWSRRDGNAEIYVMGADGSGQTNVSNQAADDMNPAWSPDGSRIAYQRKSSTSEFDIWVMSADGSNKQRLTTDGAVSDSDPTWVDNTTIAFTSNRTGNEEVWVMNDDGTNPVNLTNWSVGPDCGPGSTRPTAECRDSRPDWNANVAKYAYDANHEGDSNIWLMNADGTGQVQLTTDPGDDYDPHWSSSGTRILFTGEPFGNEDVFVMNADGTGVAPLTTSSATDGGAVFAP